MGISLARQLAQLPPEVAEEWIASLPDQMVEEMARGEWWYTARPEQIPPDGDWFIHIVLAGRGFGKSRAGSEWLVEQAIKHPLDRHGFPTEWLVIAETTSDSRRICLEGPSGILRVLQRRQIEYRLVRSPKPTITIAEYGTRIYFEGADSPDVGRGYNAAGGWLDECVAEGEPVVTTRGVVSVEDVRAGERVLTRSGWRQVEHAQVTGLDRAVLRVVAEHGSVRVTPEHLVWTENRGWVQAGDLVPGDAMVTCQHQINTRNPSPEKRKMPSSVLRVEPAGQATVYDLTVDGDPEFYAGSGSLLVHNCAKWREPRRSWIEGIAPSMRADLVEDHPRVFVTTTPKPIDLIREWVERNDGSVSIVRGSTFDNSDNLSTVMLEEMRKRYEGTNIGRQELYGELLELIEGSLFKWSDIEAGRLKIGPVNVMARAVGIDPALVADGDEADASYPSDEMGVIVASRDQRNHIYVVADESRRLAGREAALHAWNVFGQYKCDVLVYESNLGKRWMVDVLTDAYNELRDKGVFPPHTTPPMKAVHSLHGKVLRAEPVAMRYEQGTVHHIGQFEALEKQMIYWDPLDVSKHRSPDRLDALVHVVRHLMGTEKQVASIHTPGSVQLSMRNHPNSGLYVLDNRLGRQAF